MDIQLLIVTALLGIFGTVIFYVSKIFNKTESLIDQDDSKEPVAAALATDLHSRKKTNSESNVSCKFKVFLNQEKKCLRIAGKESQRTENVNRKRQVVRSQMASDNSQRPSIQGSFHGH